MRREEREMTRYLAVFHPPAILIVAHAADEIRRDTRNVVRPRYPVAAIAASSARSFPGRSLTFASYRDKFREQCRTVTASSSRPLYGGSTVELRQLAAWTLSIPPPSLALPPIRVVSGNNFAHRQNGMLIRFTSH